MDWTWRVNDRKASTELRLRYEPGGWGDVLKGAIAAELAAAMLESGPIHVADPFAGAPSYPLVDRARACLAACGGRYAELQQGDRLSSTTGLLMSAFPGRVTAAVFDSDAERRSTWNTIPGASVLDLADGWEALSPAELGAPDVVLVDPYDLVGSPQWPASMAGLRALREGGAHLVLYVFNRAPQSANDFAAYRRFRERLASGLGAPDFVGRVPNDGLLARAWHEVVLLAGRPLPRGLIDRMTEITERLAWTILRPGVTERADRLTEKR